MRVADVPLHICIGKGSKWRDEERRGEEGEGKKKEARKGQVCESRGGEEGNPSLTEHFVILKIGIRIP